MNQTAVWRTKWKRVILITLALLALAGAAVSCHPLTAYYNFDGGDQGWVLDGVYCGDQPTVLTTVSGPPIWFDNTDAASDPGKDPTGDKKGSIGFPFLGVPNCGTCQWFRIDFVSPDVGKLNNWQNLTSYSVQFADKASVLHNLKVQPLLRVKKADGTITYLREEDSSGNPVFCSLTSDWTTCKATISTAGYTVLNLVVRLFGGCSAPEGGFYEGVVYMDSVHGDK